MVTASGSCTIVIGSGTAADGEVVIFGVKFLFAAEDKERSAHIPIGQRDHIEIERGRVRFVYRSNQASFYFNGEPVIENTFWLWSAARVIDLSNPQRPRYQDASGHWRDVGQYTL